MADARDVAKRASEALSYATGTDLVERAAKSDTGRDVARKADEAIGHATGRNVAEKAVRYVRGKTKRGSERKSGRE